MSEEADESQKTEEPTPKKIEESRKKGQVALSREVNNWVMLFTGTLLLIVAADYMMGHLSGFLKIFLSQAHDMPSGAAGVSAALGNSFKEVLTIMAFPIIALMVAAFLGPFVQIGPLFSAESIKPDLGKISPLKGVKRLFSLRSLMEFAKGILKLATVSVVGAIIVYPYYGQLDHMVGLPIPLFLDELQSITVRLMIGILVVLVVVAAIDLVFQRYDHYKKLRMTKQEVKDEYKQTEGDPHVKARLRGLRAERARQRMIQSVPEADVVITNPTHYSIALRYRPGEMDAPLCLAKGVDAVALRIREVAKEHDILIYEDVPLARSLYDVVEVDEPIPVEQYKAVAEVISYVFKVKGDPRTKH
ncbi:MAG: flagellar biosynthesis protein FlhB [Alphaproteobacteria bacterium]|nr:flagellar biosynthesis protein FlhB [Alphaproteobacteria bacterium]